MQTGDIRYNDRNELDKAFFHHYMTHGSYKYLVKRAESEKVLRNKAFNIACDPKCDGYQRGSTSMVNTFFDKKYAGGGSIKNESISRKHMGF